MNQFPKAANGLKLMFYGEILAIIGIFLTLILIGPIISLVGGIMVLVGLYQAREDVEGYGTTFMLSIIGIILDIIGMFFSGGVMASLLSIISTIISLAIVYFVCTTTSNLLHCVGAVETEQRGRTVWNIYLICNIISVVLTLLLFIPLLNVLAVVGMLMAAIAQLVGYIMYLQFLNSSYKLL